MNKYIDHTLLKPDASQKGVEKLCEEAKEHSFKSVCVNPSFVALAAEKLAGTDVDVCTVIGFPLGSNTEAVKVFEAQEAIKDGATELDMVLNISKLKDGKYDEVRQEMEAIKKVAGKRVVKVILETCLLSDAEIVKACELAVEAGLDFVKTSTGFSTGGATVEDVKLMKQTVGDKAEVKASGGIRDRKTMLAMIDAGATRIGASAGIKLIENE